MGGKRTVVLAALFAVLAAGAQAGHDLARHFGTPASGTAARVVRVDAATKFIKASHLETLTIQDGKGHSFAWRFDTLHAPTGFQLKSIAPPEFEAGDAWVYVGPKP